MKRFLIVAVLAILASCAPKNKEFKLTVTFTGDPEECSAFLTSDTLILKNYTKDKENECIYKSVIADNKAVFSGIVKTPEQYALLLGPDARRPFASLFLENAQITMNVKVNESDDPSGERFTIEISGAPVQATLDSLDAAVPGNLRALVKEYYSTSDQDAKDSIMTIYEQLVAVKEEMRAEYVNAHPYSQIALMELLSNIEEISADSAKAKLEAFQALPEYSENHNIISALGTVKRLKALEPGAKAPDFTQNDPEGNPVNLYEFIKDYKAKFNEEPDTFAIHAYDGTLAVAEAIKQAGTTDGTKIADALSKIKDLQVATGKYTLDKDHNPVSGGIIIEMKDGVQTFKQKITM